MGKDSFNVGATDKLLQRLILICCCVLMFSEVAGDSSVNIFAYIGQAAKLFNIDNDYAEPALYNEPETLIASWNGTTNTVAHMNSHYSGKFYMDKERNIWIFDVERKDAGRYYVKFGARLERYEVDIILTVKGSHDYIIGLLITIMIIVIIILVILIIIIVLMYKKLCSEPEESSQSNEYTAIPTEGSETCIRYWITGQHRIQEKLCREHLRHKQSFQSQEYIAVPTEGSKKLIENQICKQIQKLQDAYPGHLKNKYHELSKEDQVHKWLNDHPDFMDKYLGKLTEDQICKQIQKWEDAYPGLSENKYHDAHENDHQVVPPTLDELSVTLTQHSGTGIDGNPNQSVSTQEIFNASQHSGEDVNNHQAVIPTLVEPPVTLTETGNEIEGNQMQMSARKMFIESRSSDELVKYDTATKTTLNELGVILCGPGSGTEDNQGQLELSQEDVITITCSSRSSGTFSELGHSGIPPFNHNKQDANPEQDMAPDVIVLMEDSDSEDKCKVPLLEGSC